MRRRGRGGYSALRVALVVTMVASFAAVVAPATASADTVEAYTGLSFRLQGCRGDAGLLPNGSGKFICSDSLYTDGNLGKGWNELDLVPHRILIDAGNSAPTSQTYHFDIAADYLNNSKVGYDVIENGFEAVSGCTASIGAQQTLSTGATTSSIYREITVTQAKNTTCQLDLYIRLGLGAHLYPGSSLHSQLLNNIETTAGIGQKTNSIPVNEIQPQSISKDMTASQGSDHVWNITKSPSAANISFGDTCAANAPGSKTFSVTVTWTKLAATPSGGITVITNVYATNPAHRTITVTVTDDIRSGTTVLDTAGPVTQDVPGNTANFLMLTHTVVVPSGTTDLNDVATATYTDKVTGIPVPGTTTATASASVQNSGTVTNDTAVITDSESITGTGLQFSVDSVTGASGSFSSYTLGTPTTGPVAWTSATQSGSGSVTFNKTIYFSGPGATTGTISDTATLTGSDGFTKTANASANISATANASLIVSKKIPFVLGTGESVSFTFTAFENGADPATATAVGSTTITFGAGDGGAVAKTGTIGNLSPNTDYDLYETAPSGWVDPGKIDVHTAALPTCSTTVDLTNNFGPAGARVKKITDPTGYEAGWEFTLSGPGAPVGGEKVTTTNNDFVNFSTALQEGSYTITETSKAGWTNISSSGCSFTVNYPADFGKVFSCTFTNKLRGSITVTKTLSGLAPPSGDVFSFDLRADSSGAPGSVLQGPVNLTGTNSFTYTFSNLVPGTYWLCENGIPAGGSSSIESDPNVKYPNPLDNSTACMPITITADANKDVSVTVDNRPPPGGNARTIGYWKNWSTCTGGNQVTVAQKNGFPYLDLFLGTAATKLGNVQLTTCSDAVKILSKRSLSGQSRSSDPLFNMAAQLLAAQLNIAAGAAHCTSADTAITQANALLTNYGWDGYKTVKQLGVTKADNALANQLAATLDSYNNNLLC